MKHLLNKWSLLILAVLKPLGVWGVLGFAAVDAAFLGMPFDSTTIARPGAQLGPRAVRDWSSHTLSYHGEYDLDIFEALGVVDMGDVNVVPANAPKTVDLVAEGMGEAIKAGALPVLMGGEHITTIGGSMAVDRRLSSVMTTTGISESCISSKRASCCWLEE